MSQPMTDVRLNEIRYLHFTMRAEQKADTQSPPDKVTMDAIGDCLDEIDRLRADLERTTEIMHTAHGWLGILQAQSRHPET